MLVKVHDATAPEDVRTTLTSFSLLIGGGGGDGSPSKFRGGAPFVRGGEVPPLN